MSDFEFISPRTRSPMPLLIHVPHSSTTVPTEIVGSLLISGDELAAEVLRMTDRYTDELFDSALDLGGWMFVNKLSRLVIDPERFPDPTMEVMEARGMGALYTRTSDGAPLRAPDARARAKLIDQYFEPYAAALADAAGEIVERFGRCLILDAHSFPSVALPYELHPEASRPHICIGIDEFHTPTELVTTIERICEAEALSTARDRPFSGTYVPLRYWKRDQRVTSVMVEVRRDLYMDESSGQRSPRFGETRVSIRRLIEEVASRTSHEGM